MTPWQELVALSRHTCPEGGWRPAEIDAAVDKAIAGAGFQREHLGDSFEGRPITLTKMGGGPKRVLLWSQMHGDEPTHTTALINLLGMLAGGDPPAATLLSGLSLGVITPLNPDGAERGVRQNAQGIDVNRDALAFATHEGRALRDAIRSFEPHYGFNLHNQPYRRSVGAPPEPIALSLLVPPANPADTPTESTREATRVAAFFAETVHEHGNGGLSRYHVPYMARAFGEWVQRQGVATLLVEASGWPGGEFTPPEKLHFAALVRTLEAIALCGLGDDTLLAGADPKSYLELPRSNTQELFDVMITGGEIAQSAHAEPTSAGIGIIFQGRTAAQRDRSEGVIHEIGDLHESGSLADLSARECLVLPGRIARIAQPGGAELQASDWSEVFTMGVTTALLEVDLGDPSKIEHLLSAEAPVHHALVGRISADSPDPRAELLLGVASGVVAVFGDRMTDALRQDCEQLGLPVLSRDDLPRADRLPPSPSDWLRETESAAASIGWDDRGRVGLGLPADLVLVEKTPRLTSTAVKTVLVDGVVAWGEGEPRGGKPRWLS